MQNRKHYSVGAFCGTLSLFLSAVYLSFGFPAVDEWFLPDDTYYTLTIARSIFNGNGASMDGIIQTSGFQPLIALLEIPLFAIFDQPESLTLAAVGISAVFAALAACLAGVIVLRETGNVWAGLLGGMLVAISPVISWNALNGLETSLAMALILCVLCFLQDMDRASSTFKLVLLGLVVALAVLARIDSVLFLLPAGLWGVARIGAVRTAIVILIAAIAVLPWVIYCMQFGAPVPESGAAVRQIIEYYIESGLQTAAEMGSHIVPVFGIFVMPTMPQIGIAVIVGTMLVTLIKCLRARRMSLNVVLLVAAIFYTSFYALYLPAFWFFDRYLNPVFTFTAILLSIELAASARKHLFSRLVFILVGSALLGLSAVAQYSFLTGPSWQRSGRGYVKQANDVLERLPNGAVLAAMQSGALTWLSGFPPYSQSEIRVVNLDGVVNQNAKNAIEDKRLAEYLRSVNATHFADWPVNVRMLNTYAGSNEGPVLGERITF